MQQNRTNREISDVQSQSAARLFLRKVPRNLASSLVTERPLSSIRCCLTLRAHRQAGQVAGVLRPASPASPAAGPRRGSGRSLPTALGLGYRTAGRPIRQPLV